jgi:hypothetical protein
MTTDAPARPLRKGDRVTPNPNYAGLPAQTLGRIFIVDKVNPKNVRTTAEDGGRGTNFPADAYVRVQPGETAPDVTARLRRELPLGRPYEPAVHFTLGEIVTLKTAFRDWGTDEPLIVFKDGGDKVNVTKLGGDNDRYVRVPKAGLVKRDRSWLAERLMDEATA